MSEDLSTHWTALLTAITARLAPDPALAPFMLDLAVCAGLEPNAAAAPGASLPIGRFWPAAIGTDQLGRLVAKVTLGQQQMGHGWRQNPNYQAKPPHPDFLKNYGYREWLGPDAAYRSENLRCGILVLGPRTLYPLHHHPADEIYLPLGTARWLREGEDWQEKTAGDVIHHPSGCGHATESGDEPLAAIYLWRGEIAKAAEIA